MTLPEPIHHLSLVLPSFFVHEQTNYIIRFLSLQELRILYARLEVEHVLPWWNLDIFCASIPNVRSRVTNKNHFQVCAINGLKKIVLDLQITYKDDVYDRIWLPYELSNDWRRLNTSLNNDDLVQNSYKPPAIVLNTAVTPINASAPLHFEWDADNVNDQYYLYIHLYDFQDQTANEIRQFNTTVNGELLYGGEIPRYPGVNTIYSRLALTPAAKRYHVSLTKTENSTLPPIFNAIE
ncbi:receptor-like protein kinase, partial [Trifolium medium]|nr:receptor-like protein kinase [Trifolium medium]